MSDTDFYLLILWMAAVGLSCCAVLGSYISDRFGILERKLGLDKKDEKEGK